MIYYTILYRFLFIVNMSRNVFAFIDTNELNNWWQLSQRCLYTNYSMLIYTRTFISMGKSRGTWGMKGAAPLPPPPLGKQIINSPCEISKDRLLNTTHT